MTTKQLSIFDFRVPAGLGFMFDFLFIDSLEGRMSSKRLFLLAEIVERTQRNCCSARGSENPCQPLVGDRADR